MPIFANAARIIRMGTMNISLPDHLKSFVDEQVAGRGSLPEKPADAIWRLTCSKCVAQSDLGWTRMNVSYDQETRMIDEISCG